MNTPTAILHVAVPCPLPGTFDYLPPSAGALPQPGMRVLVPFGRRKQVAVVHSVSAHTTMDPARLKAAEQVLDDTPLLSDDILRLAEWAAHYYHHPLGEVLAAALPVALRQGKPAEMPPPDWWQPTEAAQKEGAVAALKRAPAQRAALQRLLEQPQGQEAIGLAELGGNWRHALAALADKGLARRCAPVLPEPEPPPPLNDAQREAAAAMTGALGGYQTLLLDGVTGSGKTEVYLAVIRDVLSRGLQALVLVPEIGLTPQLIRRFRRRLPGRLAVMHSALADGERLQAWMAARSGEADVIIGTRSALFTPLPRPGLIVVDEEHDLALKQQDGFRYHARDLAAVRARQLDVPLVLGSATPSLESLHNCQQGRYRHLRLGRRAGEARPPAIHLLDIRGQPLEGGVSRELFLRMRQHLDADGQVLLFLNRRGYAPVLLCHDCGWVAHCPRCDARVTWHHRAARLRCHHCGHERRVPERCEDCGNADLRPVGQGTEQLEQILQARFPDIGLARIDRDSTRRKGAMDELLDRARSGEARILLGTQMLAKGHHLPSVTLVGILDCDQGLFGADFRAPERMAQLITQVAGRAGRAERAGEVLIQTHHPEHPLLQQLLRDGYPAFASASLAERAAAALPPYSHLALLRAEAVNADAPREFLQQARQHGLAAGAGEVMLMGPVPAPMERRAGRYRAQLLLQSPSRSALHALLNRMLPELARLPTARKVRWSLDVDPQEML
ncbi:MAG: primosomal protein N' [Ectothiorhodospiraceae bacterium]|nr:primosomal protein N' [Ectothiorhodospiraceae bacterium]